MYQLTVEYLLLLAFSNQILPEFPCNWKQKCTILNSTIIFYYLIRKPFHIMVIFSFKRKASGILDERTDLSPKRCWWSFFILVKSLKVWTLVLSLSGVFKQVCHFRKRTPAPIFGYIIMRDLCLFTNVQTIFTGGINPVPLIISYQSELLSGFVK